MSKLILFLALLGQSSALFAESLIIEPKHARFDPAIVSSTVSQFYTITNRSESAVEIRDWKAISGPGEVLYLPTELAPGESRQFRVSLKLPAQLGESGFRFALFTNEDDAERYRFTLSGFVFSVIAPEKATIDLGVVKAESNARQQLTLDAREEKPLQLVKIIDSPDWVNASLDGTTISVGIQSNASRGIKAGNVRLATNLTQQPEVEVTIKATIEGNLRPSAYALGFKPTEVGQTIRTHLELTYAGEQNLDKLRLESADDWDVVQGKCTDPASSPKNCVRFELGRIIKESGQSSGILRFSMPGEPELEIPFGIMGLAQGQSVRELLIKDDQQSAAPERIDITKAIREQREMPGSEPAPTVATPADNVSRAKGSGPVRLRWKAANDSSIYGFMVYRASDRAGPYTRVTSSPLPKQADSTADGSSGDYEFVDEGVKPGKTYFYYIDTLAENGTQQRLSPVLSKTVTP